MKDTTISRWLWVCDLFFSLHVFVWWCADTEHIIQLISVVVKIQKGKDESVIAGSDWMALRVGDEAEIKKCKESGAYQCLMSLGLGHLI